MNLEFFNCVNARKQFLHSVLGVFYKTYVDKILLNKFNGNTDTCVFIVIGLFSYYNNKVTVLKTNNYKFVILTSIVRKK